MMQYVHMCNLQSSKVVFDRIRIFYQPSNISCSRLWYHLHQREILDTIHCQSLYLLLTCCATPLVGFLVVSLAPLATSTPALRPARSPWALPVLCAPPRGAGSARPLRGSAAHRRCAPTARRLPPRAPAKLPRPHPWWVPSASAQAFWGGFWMDLTV